MNLHSIRLKSKKSKNKSENLSIKKLFCSQDGMDEASRARPVRRLKNRLPFSSGNFNLGEDEGGRGEGFVRPYIIVLNCG